MLSSGYYSFNGLMWTIAGAVLIIFSSTAIYRVFFHPLRKFPGPRLAAITSLYKTYYEVFLGGELLQHLVLLHDLHGHVVRIAPNELHFNDYAAHSVIYAIGSGFTKDKTFYRSFGADESAFGAIRPQDSRSRRNLLAPLFSRRAILRLEPIIQSKIERLTSILITNHREKPANMMFAFRCLTMDIIASYCFPTYKSALDSQDFNDPFIIATRRAIPSIWLMKFCPSLVPWFRCLPIWIARRLPRTPIMAFLELNRVLAQYIDSILEDDHLLTSGRQTIYRHLIDSANHKLRRSRRGLIEEAFLLLQAGSESPGNACAIGTFYVLNDPIIHDRLFSELRHAWPDKDTPIEYRTLEKLPYLTAVIKESLRLSHGIVTPLPRIVGPTSASISGHDVPAGAIVGVSVACINTDANLFEDPHLFLPERWLQANSKELDKYLVPFSRGPRMCIGINLAWCELYLIFGYMFRRLEMCLVDKGDFATFKDFFTPVYEETYHVIVKTRI